ncbi:MAG: putative glycosyltransferase, exosortase G system-associated [Butyrivibrio sp.]|jgi:putative glycosyltransferase (exosortase G-associated)|nr:putative glycosyltransferase, exosortase G system-associated [Butyrivibrio sp.]
MRLATQLINPFFFWISWIIIPLIMEVIPAIGGFFVLLKGLIHRKKIPVPDRYPEITLIIPVYNSQDSLEGCIRSVNDSDYPNRCINVFLVNNQGKDDSFEVYTKCQEKYSDLRMQWLNAMQGKSRALNLAIYNSEGKYIIHIDSDGILEPTALSRMVCRFEADTSVNCMTGTILTIPEQIEAYRTWKSRFLRKLEFTEYAQAFLAGRNYASEFNAIYTLSGAFSGFRKSALRGSWLYNTDTICEDTEITFQMKYIQHQVVKICEDAIFFVGPIENMDKLYTQRQRWQRGSLEVARMFPQSKLQPFRMFRDTNVKTLMYDHTFAFPRIIWYLALIYLMFIGYSGKVVLVSTGLIMLFYVLCGYLYFLISQKLLEDFHKIRKYYLKQWWVIAFLPLFNLLVFFIRFAGIINSIHTNSAWKTSTLSEENTAFRSTVRRDAGHVIRVVRTFRNYVNEPEEKEAYESHS